MTRPALRLAPSLLSADFARLAEELAEVEEAGADWHHVDVMDGHFVPNLTIGPPVVKRVKAATRIPLDVHLMITDPMKYAGPFLDAGADWLSFHIEALPEPGPLIELIRKHGAHPGLVLNPDTPVEAVIEWGGAVDMILVMSVFPGFGGQSFMPEVLDKVRALRKRWPDLDIEIDGGISNATIGLAVGAGANVLVAGSAIYGQSDRRAALDGLRARALAGFNLSNDRGITGP